MIKNYLRVAFRNLWRHKGFSLLNIIGLTVGMAAFFLIFLYVCFELSYDSFHSKADRIYRIVADVPSPTGLQHANNPPLPTTVGMKEQLPEVELTTRVSLGDNWMVIRGDQVFETDDVMLSDTGFFRVFDFPLVKGDPRKALAGPQSVVLSQTVAKRFFGNVDPIGKVLTMTRDKFPCTVTGVMKDLPGNSHLKASMIISVATFERMDSTLNRSWDSYGWSAYVLLKPGAGADRLQAKLPGYLEKKGGAALFRNKQVPTLLLEPLRDIYLYSTRDESRTGHITNVYIFSIIGAFIVLIAGINFVNLTTARSVERAKEVGIRKVVGAGKWMLAGQFIGESIILCLMAYVLAIGLSVVMLPLFNQLAGKEVSMGIFTQPRYLAVLFGIALLIGIFAGLYPALVLSSFRPVAVLKGKFSTGTRGILLRKGLVILQFTIAIGLMIATLVVYFQLNYMRSQDLGFSKDQKLIMDTRNDSAKLAFRQALASIPGVLSNSLAGNVPGLGTFPNECRIENGRGVMQSTNAVVYFVDYDYLRQLDMKVIAGRDFSRAYGTDSSRAMILNETAVSQLGYPSPKEAIGKRFEQFGTTGTIIGVVKDFHLRALQDPIQAMTMRVEPGNCDLICATIDGRRLKETMSAVEAKWKLLLKDRPFSYFFLDEFFNRQYRGEEHFGRLFLNFAILAISISCLGLMGLAAYSTLQRTKEIGVRKVVGASVGNIVYLLSKDFLKLVGWAFLVAAPLSWFFVNGWLRGFAYRIGSYWWIFFIAGFGALAIALLTVSFQAIKAALANPVNSLRTE
ncbi:MAG TPA: ABC transporter permease [Puia sp.]|uniref:ABC transporter permease n=1 Tax=Puia sp. TaxID=2045100 RepID=UPI002BFF3ABC|nr:ABC transporter permease [Puia sp.]HVU99298.1 ABC transporter permease [Puia sp.]